MKLFLKKIFYFLMMYLILIITLSLISKKIPSNYGNFKLKTSINTIILGHSQTECGLNDAYISNTINISQGGEAYFYTYQKLKKIIQINPNIKSVILSFSNNQINGLMNDWTYGDESMQAYYPKYNFMMETADVTILFKNNPKSFLISENKSITSNIKYGVNSKKNSIDDKTWGAYLNLKDSKIDSLVTNRYLDKLKAKKINDISFINLHYLDKIQSFCQSNKIQLILIRMPLFKDFFDIQNENQFQKVRLKKYKNLKFIDLAKFPINKEEFRDFEHLNFKGAKKVSQFVNIQIKRNGLD